MDKKIDSAASYREMLIPFESIDVANMSINRFADELKVLRKKYRLPDVYVILRIPVKDEDGNEGIVHSHVAFGDTMNAESMTAWAFGQAQSDRQQRIAAMLKPVITHHDGR